MKKEKICFWNTVKKLLNNIMFNKQLKTFPHMHLNNQDLNYLMLVYNI